MIVYPMVLAWVLLQKTSSFFFSLWHVFCTVVWASNLYFAEISNQTHCQYLCLLSMSSPAHNMPATHPTHFFSSIYIFSGNLFRAIIYLELKENFGYFFILIFLGLKSFVHWFKMFYLINLSNKLEITHHINIYNRTPLTLWM